MRDVHEFDGKYRIEGLVDVENRDDLIHTFSSRPLNPHVRLMLDKLLNLQDPQNYDPLHACKAIDLLLSLLHKISLLPENDREEWFLLLEEQLSDMIRLGPCPQGRTARLWQLHTSLS